MVGHTGVASLFLIVVFSPSEEVDIYFAVVGRYEYGKTSCNVVQAGMSCIIQALRERKKLFSFINELCCCITHTLITMRI